MILRVESCAACLVCPEARSQMGGYHYLSDKKGELFNGPILVLAKVIKNAMASAAEAEVGAPHMSAQEAAGVKNTLEEMGHPQPATSIETDNSATQRVINGTIEQKRSKAIDMRFYWVKDRVKQGQFHIFWMPGDTNLADYWTKHHPPAHHRAMRPIIHNNGHYYFQEGTK